MMTDPIAWVKAQYWSRRDHRDASAGTADAGLPVVLNSLGKLASTLITPYVGNLAIGGQLSVTGATSETALGSDSVRFGVVAGTPRIILEDATFTQWEIDNSGGTLRIFTPGVIKLTHDGTTCTVANNLTVSGNFAVTGNLGTWTNLTYETGWVDFGGGLQGGQYRKIGDLVFLRGICKRTSGVATTITTLPSLHRPPAPLLFNVLSNDALGRVDLSTGGVLSLTIGSATYVNLSDIPPISIT
jgi:hypothetical protein